MEACVIESTSKKHHNFVGEKIEKKEVTSLPGIGLVFGRLLREAGFTAVLGLGRNEEKFKT